MKAPGRDLVKLLSATVLGCLISCSCSANRIGKPAGANIGHNPDSYPDASASDSADPYDSAEIPPEALEFPEPPGSAADSAPDPAAGKTPDLDSPIPDLSEQLPLIPALLEPRGPDGFKELIDRNNVVDKFDMPTVMENHRFIYSKHRSFPDFKQVIFFFDFEGKLRRVDLFPSASITRQQLIERYGGSFSRKTSGSYEILHYKRMRLVFFLLAASDTVYSIRLKK